MLRSNRDIPSFAIRVNSIIDADGVELYRYLYRAMRKMLPDQSEDDASIRARIVAAYALDMGRSSSIYISFLGGIACVDGTFTDYPVMHISRFKKLFGGN